jgi:bifunctional non-homologous end joining protein LigD
VADAGGDAHAMIAPMMATPGPVPGGSGAGWAFEVKFDGVRAIGYARPGGLRLVSRNDRDVTASYPEIGALDLGGVEGSDAGIVLDGELVALDGRGRPDFELLQHRMHVVRPSAELVAQVPVGYVVFDVLRLGGQSLLGAPYRERRELLAGLGLAGRGMQVPPNFTGTPGAVVLDAVAQQGLEGVVAKRLESSYQPGRRSKSWVKTAIRHTHEVVVVGWSPSRGHRGVLSALLLGAHDEHGALVYVGDVGTGFTDMARARLLERLRPLARAGSPFGGEFVRARGWPGRAPTDEVHWVAPELVGEIEYRAFTRDGRFRHPSWRGLRADRDPAEVLLPPRD